MDFEQEILKLICLGYPIRLDRLSGDTTNSFSRLPEQGFSGWPHGKKPFSIQKDGPEVISTLFRVWKVAGVLSGQVA
jgi:hypothetical protein